MQKLLWLIVLLSLSSPNVVAKPDDETIKRIDSYLSKSAADGFAGSVLIAGEGEVLLNKGYGLADQENNIPVRPETVFDIGSLTKQFTGAAILKLVEMNKLALDDKLSVFFNDLPADKCNITIHQLLTHTSGILTLPDKGDFDLVATEDFFQRLFAQESEFLPGSRYSYSNAGYSILGRIIELVSGLEYETFLNTYLFKPAGMTQTGYLKPDWSSSTAAKGYTYGVLPQGSMLARYIKAGEVSWVLKGNGGLQSTVVDIHKWLNALESNLILSAQSKVKLTTPYVAEDESGESFYAYGWAIFKTPRNTKLVAHNGSNMIFFADVLWFTDEQLQIVFLTNMYSDKTFSLSWNMEASLFDSNYQFDRFSLPDAAKMVNFISSFKGEQRVFTEQIAEQFGHVRDLSVQLNRLAYDYYKQGNSTVALNLLRANVVLHKGDGNLWDSLGEILYKTGALQEAKKAFEKALMLKRSKDCTWCENSAYYLNLMG